MKPINNIKIYCNDNDNSNNVLIKLEKSLRENGFNLTDDNPDLAIAIGGDGSFLRMVKKENYNSDLIYVGINAGTLGFLQEIQIDDITSFVNSLKEDSFYIEEIGIQETEVYSKNEIYNYCSLNEIVIREKELNTAFFEVSINDNLLEKYVGDGLLIATSVGSTAYNLSFGGSIVYNKLHTLQITPIAPLNSKAYRNLLNTVITPEKASITIKPTNERNNLLISVDGENKIIDNVEYINTKVEDKRLKFFHLKNYNYWQKVNEKFLSK